MNEPRKKIYVYFNDTLDGGLPLEEHEIAELMFDLVKKRRQKFYEVPYNQANWQSLISLDKVNCIIIMPKKNGE